VQKIIIVCNESFGPTDQQLPATPSGVEKNPLFAAKPRFRELWKREKRGKGGEKEGKEERGKERDLGTDLMNHSSNFSAV
jgi:hypothetical protein